MAEIRDYEKKNIKKRPGNDPGGACKNDGKSISSVNTIAPSANLVATVDGYLHYWSLFYCLLQRHCVNNHSRSFTSDCKDKMDYSVSVFMSYLFRYSARSGSLEKSKRFLKS